jgi:hypothetical protein
MSWNIYKLGTKKQVEDAVNNTQEYDGCGTLLIGKNACAEFLKSIPEDSTVDLAASGHSFVNDDSASGEVSIKIKYSK